MDVSGRGDGKIRAEDRHRPGSVQTTDSGTKRGSMGTADREVDEESEGGGSGPARGT